MHSQWDVKFPFDVCSDGRTCGENWGLHSMPFPEPGDRGGKKYSPNQLRVLDEVAFLNSMILKLSHFWVF